jgi:hypothetical protein
MKIIWAQQRIDSTVTAPSLFLAGPTRREHTQTCVFCRGKGEERDYSADPDLGHRYKPCSQCSGKGWTEIPAWRKDALAHLRKVMFAGHVFVPELKNFAAPDKSFDRQQQWQWEWRALEHASFIVFWVPRTMRELPGLTTNIEFGMYGSSGKAVFGAPPEAEHVDYLRALAERWRVPTFNALEETLDAALGFLKGRL